MPRPRPARSACPAASSTSAVSSQFPRAPADDSPTPAVGAVRLWDESPMVESVRPIYTEIERVRCFITVDRSAHRADTHSDRTPSRPPFTCIGRSSIGALHLHSGHGPVLSSRALAHHGQSRREWSAVHRTSTTRSRIERATRTALGCWASGMSSSGMSTTTYGKRVIPNAPYFAAGHSRGLAGSHDLFPRHEWSRGRHRVALLVFGVWVVLAARWCTRSSMSSCWRRSSTAWGIGAAKNFDNTAYTPGCWPG